MSTSSKPAARKTPAKSAAKSASTDAIEMLTADHKEVKALFKQYDELVEAEADDDEKQALAEQICQMLTVHATIEEEIFYPAAREVLGDDEDLVDEADVEHATAKDLIAQIEASSPARTRCTTPRSRCWASTSTTTSRKRKARCSRRSRRPSSTRAAHRRSRWPTARRS